MKIINMTPIDVRVAMGEHIQVFKPSGKVANVTERVLFTQNYIAQRLGLQSVQSGCDLTEIENLPDEPQEETLYIVSLMVLQRVEADGFLREVWREHLCAPFTGRSGPKAVMPVRDARGHIDHVTALRFMR